jgi:hypothetical protein
MIRDNWILRGAIAERILHLRLLSRDILDKYRSSAEINDGFR